MLGSDSFARFESRSGVLTAPERFCRLLALRVTDRVGDEIAVELPPGSRAAAEEIVERLQAGRR